MKALLALLSTLLLATCSQPPPLLRADPGRRRTAGRHPQQPGRLLPRQPRPGGPGLRTRQPLRRAPRRARCACTRSGPAKPPSTRSPQDARTSPRPGCRPASSCPASAQFGPGYQLVREHLVYRRRAARPASIREAARGQIEVAAGSAHQRTLRGPAAAAPGPRLDRARGHRHRGDPGRRLAGHGAVHARVAPPSSRSTASVHPELAIALDLSPERALAWVVNTAGHDSQPARPRQRVLRAGARATA